MGLKPTPSPYVFGIDLGTSNSSISVYTKGKSITIPLEGKLSIPSVVYFPKENAKGDVLAKVGREAKKRMLIDPDRTFASIKTLMKNDDWKEEEVLKQKFTIDEKELSPTDVATEILKKILDEVHSQQEFDTNGQITKAVICVPANTTEKYRNNVYKAAQAAGLGEKDSNGDVLIDEEGRPIGVSILEEPTAAAIAYGRELGMFDGQSKEQTILVYDLGGGTFDVTILKVDSNAATPTFSLLATKGIAQLGGDDFDRAIMDICANEFKEISGIDIFDLKSDQKATSAKTLKNTQQKLKEAAEEAKIAMAGGSEKIDIDIPEFLKDGEGASYNLEVEVKKSVFLEKIQSMLEEANKCVEDSLKEASLTIDDINRIILVGGSTKADWVTESIVKIGKKPYMAKNVDIIVSQGAAVFGATKPVENIDLKRITSHHLGIELENGEFSPIIEKGLPLDKENPIQIATKTYGNQENIDSLQITIWKTQHTIEFEEKEGLRIPANKLYVNNSDGAFDCIGDFILKGIPKAPRASQKIEMTMEINQENLLKVQAKVQATNSEESLELKISQN